MDELVFCHICKEKLITSYHDINECVTNFEKQLTQAEERAAELELVLQEILQVGPLNVFGPMSDRMKRLAREALTQKQE